MKTAVSYSDRRWFTINQWQVERPNAYLRIYLRTNYAIHCHSQRQSTGHLLLTTHYYGCRDI